MPSIKFPEEKHLIPKPELVEHAAMAALNAVVGQLPGLETWQRGTLRKLPMSIYDINGKLLFLDYPVAAGGEVVGKVRAAASAVLGAPVISLIREFGTWDFGQSAEKLAGRIKKDFKEWKVGPPKLVCYSYPKLGVMFSGTDPHGKRGRLIFDVTSLDLIPEAKPGDMGREGAFAWSFYDSLSDDKRGEGIELAKKYKKVRAEVGDVGLTAMLASKTLFSIKDSLVAVFPAWKTTTKELQYCTHYAYNEARSHHCFVLHGQQTWDYCAVATCQMILCYYRYYYTQDQIAPSLNYAPGGCPSDQSAGYESLSNNHIDASYDNTPTFAEAKTQINGLHPFKSGISGHARACAGYSQTSWYNIVTSSKLYIYDPSPWNADYKLAGSIQWENWDLPAKTNFVTTRLDY